jgi:NAD(P)H-dependent FMN reductase
VASIIGVCGSLRRASFNLMLLRAAVEAAPAGSSIQIESIRDIPLYDGDVEAEQGIPPAVQQLKARIAAADGLLIVTPEYNNSITGVLKNAIDWLSRPWGNGALKDKPLAVIGTALGQYGGVWAQDETRKSFGIAGARVVEDLKLPIPTKTLDGRHPREHAEVGASVREVVGKLVAEIA